MAVYGKRKKKIQELISAKGVDAMLIARRQIIPKFNTSDTVNSCETRYHPN
jgi:hypothetical protein